MRAKTREQQIDLLKQRNFRPTSTLKRHASYLLGHHAPVAYKGSAGQHSYQEAEHPSDKRDPLELLLLLFLLLRPVRDVHARVVLAVAGRVRLAARLDHDDLLTRSRVRVAGLVRRGAAAHVLRVGPGGKEQGNSQPEQLGRQRIAAYMSCILG